MLTGKFVVSGCFAAILGLLAGPALAQSAQSSLGGGGGGNGGCNSLPNWGQLKSALSSSITASSGANGGLGFNMWGVIVDNSGIVCAVAFSGGNFTYQWLASRVIAAQKANTANSLSLSQGVTPAASAVGIGRARALDRQPLLGGAAGRKPLWAAAQQSRRHRRRLWRRPGSIARRPTLRTFGTTSDPMVGQRIGGVNVFGGGLGLYKGGVRVGGLGVSGDQSCTDHMVAWRTRHALNLDQLHGVTGPAALFATILRHPDNIIFDITPNPNGGTGISASGFGHATCFNNPSPAALAQLPAVQ